MATTFSKLAEGLAAWLSFEKRCGRDHLFSEAYLAYPLAQLLKYRFEGKVLAEIEHPVLSQLKTGSGSKPRVDFGVTRTGKVFKLVLETKWLSGSPNLVRDLIRDIVRLDLLVPQYAESGLLLVAGEKRAFNALFQRADFVGHKPKWLSNHLLPVLRITGSLNLTDPATPARAAFFKRVLSVFAGTKVSERIPLVRSGPHPANARTRDYQVYIWRLRSFSGEGPRFLVEPSS